MAVPDKATALRQELKAWEKEFASANGGRKAGRDDIKKYPEIAAKYKEYTKMRDPSSGQDKNSKAHKSQTSHRSSLPNTQKDSVSTTSLLRKVEAIETPSKRRRTYYDDGSNYYNPRRNLLTPSRRRHSQQQDQPYMGPITPSRRNHPGFLDPYDSPSSIRKLSTPPKVTAIGPTPQRDGYALGIFDLLSEHGTPQGPQTSGEPTGNAPPNANAVLQTPSKSSSSAVLDEAIIMTGKRGNRTPASSSKRFFLDSFTTPLKRKREDDPDGIGGPETPSSSTSNLLATPAFLRRDGGRKPLDAVLEEDEQTSPMTQRFWPKRRTYVKGLSTILAELREMQQEDDADGEEALREIEGNQGRPSRLGPDQEEGEEEHPGKENEKQGANANNSKWKFWKKKGAKRQTRKFNLKPVLRKSSKT
ncbi:hypothetical protein L228DRAFT_269337 [Xylona heveae TC161]|uniref:DNA replication regulator SLD2 n=1 Tax=Xylona heveae (strain CBS 132557 / TC161) TaxID=1328760 RepID=A0A165G8Z1_XYLHT|nr:hypothetical protein L228DRAFT_269337 [Xylona heveae TC161]KZF21889.1 hypothetical protein L228DRAFT_269337 [Xylona heveae TC161]